MNTLVENILTDLIVGFVAIVILLMTYVVLLGITSDDPWDE